jgi:hypothetical protein
MFVFEFPTRTMSKRSLLKSLPSTVELDRCGQVKRVERGSIKRLALDGAAAQGAALLARFGRAYAAQRDEGLGLHAEAFIFSAPPLGPPKHSKTAALCTER